MIDEKKLIEQIRTNGIPGEGFSDWERENMVVNIINSQPKIGGWIPCIEPPKDDKQVLIFNGKSYSVGYYDGKTWVNATHPIKWKPIEPCDF